MNKMTGVTGFSHPVLVRWSDIDSYDHVNNVRYFDYLQEARIAFLSTVFEARDSPRGSGGRPPEGIFAEHPIVLASQTVDYLRPMHLRHPPYDVVVWVTAIGTTSYTLRSEILDGELVYARAASVMVAVDPVTHAKRPLTGAERGILTGHLRD
jgi:acyl-CoA thioester hydrolase